MNNLEMKTHFGELQLDQPAKVVISIGNYGSLTTDDIRVEGDSIIVEMLPVDAVQVAGRIVGELEAMDRVDELAERQAQRALAAKMTEDLKTKKTATVKLTGGNDEPPNN